MTNVNQFVQQALLTCQSCDYEGEDAGAAMVHSMNTSHTLLGATPDGHVVSISVEQE